MCCLELRLCSTRRIFVSFNSHIISSFSIVPVFTETSHKHHAPCLLPGDKLRHHAGPDSNATVARAGFQVTAPPLCYVTASRRSYVRLYPCAADVEASATFVKRFSKRSPTTVKARVLTAVCCGQSRTGSYRLRRSCPACCCRHRRRRRIMSGHRETGRLSLRGLHSDSMCTLEHTMRPPLWFLPSCWTRLQTSHRRRFRYPADGRRPCCRWVCSRTAGARSRGTSR